MVSLPENEITDADMHEWYRLQEELKRIRGAEMLLRTKIFKAIFTAPSEGTNNHSLADGYVLKGKYNITRDLDVGAFGANKVRFAEAGISTDAMVQYKPSLVLSEYRQLTAEQRQLFDECLIIKPGSPSLEIVLPAKAKAAKAKAQEAEC